MTVGDYIKQKFQPFGIQLSEVEILDIAMSGKVESHDEMTSSLSSRVMVAIVEFIPSLLLRATSVNESGFSVSWDMAGIKDYYSLMCKRYGLTDELNAKPTVRFL